MLHVLIYQEVGHNRPPQTVCVFNPFIAPACKISGLKNTHGGVQTVHFRGSVTHLLSILCVLIEILSRIYAKKKKKDEGFQISHFYWSFFFKRHRGSEGVKY